MENKNPLLGKSYQFSIRIVNASRHLMSEKKEYILSKQLLRSGTSIGANAEEAQGGQSRKDFVSKISISYKEARETHYWLRLLRDTDFLEQKVADSLIKDCEELKKILFSIIKSSTIKH